MQTKDISKTHQENIRKLRVAAQRRHEASRKELAELSSQIDSKGKAKGAYRAKFKEALKKGCSAEQISEAKGKIADVKKKLSEGSALIKELQTEKVEAQKHHVEVMKQLEGALSKFKTTKELKDQAQVVKAQEKVIAKTQAAHAHRLKVIDYKIATFNQKNKREEEERKWIEEVESLFRDVKVTDGSNTNLLMPDAYWQLNDEIAALEAQVVKATKATEANELLAEVIFDESINVSNTFGSFFSSKKDAAAQTTDVSDLISDLLVAISDSVKDKPGIQLLSKEFLESMSLDGILKIAKTLELWPLAKFIMSNPVRLGKLGLYMSKISDELVEKGLDNTPSNILQHSEILANLVNNPTIIAILHENKDILGNIVQTLEKDIGVIVDFVLNTPSTMKPESILALLTKVLSVEENFKNIVAIASENLDSFLSVLEDGKELNKVLRDRLGIGEPALIKPLLMHFKNLITTLPAHHAEILAVLTALQALLVADEAGKEAALNNLVKLGIALLTHKGTNGKTLLADLIENVSTINLSDIADVAFSAKPVTDALNKLGIGEKEIGKIKTLLLKLQPILSILPDHAENISEYLSIPVMALLNMADGVSQEEKYAIMDPTYLLQHQDKSGKTLLQQISDVFGSLSEDEKKALSEVALAVARTQLEEMTLTLALKKENIERSKSLLIAQLDALLSSGAITKEEYDRLKNQVMISTTVGALQIVVAEVRTKKLNLYIQVDHEMLPELSNILSNSKNDDDLTIVTMSLLGFVPMILMAVEGNLDNIRKVAFLTGNTSVLALGRLAKAVPAILETILNDATLVGSLRNLLSNNRDQIAHIVKPIVHNAIKPDYARILASKKVHVPHEHHSNVITALEQHFAEHAHTNEEKLKEILQTLLSEGNHHAVIAKRAHKAFSMVADARLAAINIVESTDFKGMLDIADRLLANHKTIAPKLQGLDGVLEKMVILGAINSSLSDQKVSTHKKKELRKLAKTHALSSDDIAKLVEFGLTIASSADLGNDDTVTNLMNVLTSEDAKHLIGFALGIKDEQLDFVQNGLRQVVSLAAQFLGRDSLTDLNAILPGNLKNILDKVGVVDDKKEGDAAIKDIMKNAAGIAKWAAGILKSPKFQELYKGSVVNFINAHNDLLVDKLNVIIKDDNDLRFMKLDAQKIVNILKDPDTVQKLAEFIDAFETGKESQADIISKIARGGKIVKAGLGLAFSSSDSFFMLVNVLFRLINKVLRDIVMPDFLKRLIANSAVSEVFSGLPEKNVTTDGSKGRVDLAKQIAEHSKDIPGLHGYFIRRLNFSGLDLTEANANNTFTNSKIKGMDFARCQFQDGLNLSGSELIGTDFSNIILGTKTIDLTNAVIDLKTLKTLIPLINDPSVTVITHNVRLKISVTEMKKEDDMYQLITNIDFQNALRDNAPIVSHEAALDQGHSHHPAAQI